MADSLATVLEGLTGKLPSTAKEFLQAIYNENARLIRLTRNLLNISRRGGPQTSHQFNFF